MIDVKQCVLGHKTCCYVDLISCMQILTNILILIYFVQEKDQDWNFCVDILFVWESIATREKNALLLYNGRYNNRHDFIALEIVDGQAVFSFSLGTSVSDVTAHRTEGISDGKWHQITVDYYNRV